jgi:hypothetical protein
MKNACAVLFNRTAVQEEIAVAEMRGQRIKLNQVQLIQLKSSEAAYALKSICRLAKPWKVHETLALVNSPAT